jgi:hypothetical protein
MRSANSSPVKKPVRLSSKFVAGLPPGVMYWDDDPKATGFGVRSYPGGGRSFFIDYRLNGRQRRYTIGPFPRWSVEAPERKRGSYVERSTGASISLAISASVGQRLPSKT